MTAICQQCGSPLDPQGLPDALCPACLWQIPHDECDTLGSEAIEYPAIPGHQILEELARGGMGVVYRARQESPKREVAIKMLLPGDGRRHDLRERFRVEIRSLAELDHPDILPLYQVGESDGRPWFSMKLAAGGSLATRLRAHPSPIAPAEAARLITNLAEALHYAHSHGVLHRDIKPGNVLFDERNTAFLADFGLAKLLDGESEMTRSGAIMGTPCYMAPEVASHGARAATVASDIYSLGAVFYELLSGRPPFQIEGMAALVRKIVDEEPQRPSTFVPNLSRDLELVCLTCLAKDPLSRYTSAGALAEDIRRWQRGEPVTARRARLPARLWSWAKRRPALAATAATLALTVIGSATGLAIAYSDLRIAHDEERKARTRADDHSVFLIGEFADSLESLGRLDLVESACKRASDLPPPTDNQGRKLSARLHLRWGLIRYARGDSAGAAEKFLHAQSHADAALALAPTDADAAALGLSARTRRAEVLADFTSYQEAHRLLDEASASLEASRILPIDDALRLRAEIDRTRATILIKLRRDAGGVEEAALATASFRAWHARNPLDLARCVGVLQALRDEGNARFNRFFTQKAGSPESVEALQNALSVFRQGTEQAAAFLKSPGALPSLEFEYAQLAGGVGAVLLRLGPDHYPDALTHLQIDHDTMARLVSEDPKNWRWQFKLSEAEGNMARYYQFTGQPDLARDYQQRRRSRLASIAEQDPKVREWRLSELAVMGEEMAEAIAQGDLAAARSISEKRASEAFELVQRQPASRTEQDGWRNLTWEMAEAWKGAADFEQAERVYTNAIALAQSEAATSPAANWWRWTGGHLNRRLAEVRRKTGDTQGTLAANRAALDDRAHVLRSRALPALEDPGAVANAYANTEVTLLDLERWEDAVTTATEALDLYVEHRDIAGPPTAWAAPLVQVLQACKAAKRPTSESIKSLAQRAVEGFYPAGSETSWTKQDKTLVRELRELARTDIPASPALRAP